MREMDLSLPTTYTAHEECLVAVAKMNISQKNGN